MKLSPAQKNAVKVLQELHQDNPLDVCVGGLVGAGVGRQTIYALLNRGVLRVRKRSERLNRGWTDTYYNFNADVLGVD